MITFQLFTDGSVNNELKVGYGACLLISDENKDSIVNLRNLVEVKKFENTSATKLELQTLLWALEKTEILVGNNISTSIIVYTDSQNIVSLPNRQSEFEKNNYFSRRKKKLKHHVLYKKFYQFNSKLNCDFVKVSGHLSHKKKNNIDKVFSLVDTESRRILRNNCRTKRSSAMIEKNNKYDDIKLRLEARSGKVMDVNLFSGVDNLNIAVAGSSGSGKSILIKKTIINTIEKDGRAFVFDNGFDYRQICELLDGKLISFEQNANICINPFSVIKSKDDFGDRYQNYLSNVLKMIDVVICSIVSKGRNLSYMQKAKVSQAIREAWEIHSQDSDFSKIAENLSKIDQKLANEMDDYINGGKYYNLVNGKSNIDLTNNFVLFGLESLNNDLGLQRVIKQIMSAQILNQVLIDGIQAPTHIVIDEAWNDLSNLEMSSFFEKISRKLPKYKISLIFSARDIKYFYINKFSQKLFEKAAWQFLTEQNPKGLSELQEDGFFRLDSREQKKLKYITHSGNKY
ncbi:MAG: hypothetical protein HRT87_10550, partial [Legionellales bacterium]|nr:hypothetical protein [Legionellales bacterium]